MFIIGLTGGIGTGKSTVSKMFAQLGAKIIDADNIVHQLLNLHGGCVMAVGRAFGSGIVKNNKIDRKALADVVFRDVDKLRKLEKIIHPKVRAELKRQVADIKRRSPDSIVILEVPLLFESGLDRDVDMTIVVKATRDLQISRAMKKLNLSKDQVLQRMQSQWPMAKKAKLADILINNKDSKNETLKKVKKIWQKVQQKQKR